ncbi:MAG: 2-oxoacid:ferredoxin oxidoreductase subunit beta [Dehalococcoidales bacterium]|nr:2-oxoacid:ferredoxin oxidoreductase subunit beta [Dehalococcoidales bacterium]
MVTLQDYAPASAITWCPGCGNFGILQAFRKAMVALNIEPHRLLMVSGIGQAPKLPHYTRGNVFNGLHGRAIPAATGAKLANPELYVVVIDGDGGAYGEGLSHTLAAMRRNVRMTYMVHNNQVYGLTKGQASPTSDAGFITKTTPLGAGQPVNPLTLALASDISFLARGFAGDIEHLANLLQMAVNHRGFALVDILQPCVSFNHRNTFQWYKERVYKLDEDKSYDPASKTAAFAKAQEWGDRIPIGLIYKEERPTYEELLPALKKTPLARQKLDPRQFAPLLDEFM